MTTLARNVPVLIHLAVDGILRIPGRMWASAPTVEPGRISDYRRVTPKTCVILSGAKRNRRIFYVPKRNHAQDPSARAFGAAQDDAGG